MGNDIKPKQPKITITMEITVESTGRLMNLSSVIVNLLKSINLKPFDWDEPLHVKVFVD